MTASGIVAVVGATGQQGATARALLAAGANVRALSFATRPSRQRRRLQRQARS